jgi:RecA/RadA recombinase
MEKTRWQQLDATVTAIQKQWGMSAIQKGWQREETHSHPSIPIGIPRLDALLDIGGLPQGHLTELIGRGTAGHLTLALSAMHQAQLRKRHVVYIDLSQSIDLDYMAQCGVDFGSLIVVRPDNAEQVFRCIRELSTAGVGAIVLDRVNDLLMGFTSDRQLSQYLRNLRSVLHPTGCALILLTDLAGAEYPEPVLPNYVSVRIQCEHERWHYQRRRVAGYTSRITILKNKFAPSGRTLSMHFSFDRRRK